MKNMNLSLLIVIILLSSNSCDKDTLADDDLSLNKISYTGNQIRTDGYFYNEYIPGYLTVYFFYRDGTVLYGSSFPTNELNVQEDKYSNGDHYSFAKNLKYYWGICKVEGNELLFERWYPSQPPLKAYIRSGIIHNDTAFKITEYYRMQGGQKTNVEFRNEVYHFKAFSPKPDSTNSFVN